MNPRQLKAVLQRVLVVIATTTVFLGISHAAAYKRVHNFGAGLDGADPATQLAFDGAGNAYGTTAAGGDFDLGTIFMITPSGEEQILWSFTGGIDGSDPHGGVTLDAAGNMYGTVVAGGGGGFCAGDGCGVVFELKPSGGSWTLDTLYNFTGLDDAPYRICNWHLYCG